MIGITVSRSGRKTAIQLLLIKETGDAHVRLFDYDFLQHFFDQPDRFLDITAKSLSEALIGRHLAEVLAKAKKPLDNFAEVNVTGALRTSKVSSYTVLRSNP